MLLSPVCVSLVFALSLFFSFCEAESNLYPNNCVNLKDGIHLLKLLNGDNFPVIKVKCSNGYIMLDYSLDNNIKYYFNSWMQIYLKTAGPTAEYNLNWENWFIPSSQTKNKQDNMFIVSNKCTVCDENNIWNRLNTKTTYYGTANFMGCYAGFAVAQCHIIDSSYTCQSCPTGPYGAIYEITTDNLIEWKDSATMNVDSLYKTTGSCPYVTKLSNLKMPNNHDECTNSFYSVSDPWYKPSIGTHGNQCVCYKQNKKITNYYTGSYSYNTNDEKNEINSGSINDIYSLYSKHFKSGTYRITKSGTYNIMEDIKFDFNSNKHNPIEGWKPLASQKDEYPGAGGYYDIYFLGFFAGIAIECDNVIVNLNGHSLSMSENFYYSQRWFTVIELSKQYFWPGQGAGFFGGSPYQSSDITIMNGVLGLSSHHGIHGNQNTNVKIIDIHVKDFETHGIQLNGFNNLEMINVEVGPTSSIVYLNGEFGHWKYLLPRIKSVAEETMDKEIHFYGRDNSVTMQDIADEIELKMKYAWNYIVNGKSYNEKDDEYSDFIDSLKLFTHSESSITYSSAQYGIFLNTYHASVFTYKKNSDLKSNNASLRNIKIHGMRHKMIEYPKFFESLMPNDAFRNPLTAPLDASSAIGDIDTFDVNEFYNGNVAYKGNILTDAFIALNYFSNNWSILAQQHIGNDELVNWALYNDISGLQNVGLSCNSDVMLHSGKGTIGLRFDGVQNIRIENVEIYDNYDSTDLGLNVCGEYDTLKPGDSIGGTFGQVLPIQMGFSGNTNQGICITASQDITLKDVSIHDLSSAYGDVFAIAIWPNNKNIKFSGDININSIYGGISLKKDTYTYDSRPNAAPEACGIRVYEQYENYITTVLQDSDNSNNKFTYSCIDGHVSCFGGIENYKYLNKVIFNQDIIKYSEYSTIGNENKNSKCLQSIHKQSINLLSMFNKLENNKKSKSCGILVLVCSLLFIVVFTFIYYNIISHEKDSLNYFYSQIDSMETYGSFRV